jgi:negative regulator of flagellin synthesis FlgM
MSYANGVGNPQQPVTPITPSVTAAVSKTSASSEESRASAASNPNADSIDQATLSSSASLVSQALQGSDINSAKVSSLLQAIAAGSYNVSSSDVADKMIRSLLE